MTRILGGFCLLASFLLLIGSASAADAPAKGKGKLAGKFGDPEAMFKKLDANNDGKLSKDEFLKILDKLPADKQEQAKTALSKLFDKISNGSDGITLEQLRKAGAEFKKGKKKTAE